jgi:hypothetical protein
MYLTTGRKNLRYKKMQYNYSKKMLTRRAKPSRIIGIPNNQRPDKWSSTVLRAFVESLI